MNTRRPEIDRLLIHKAEIQRGTKVRNGVGWTIKWKTIKPEFPCRFSIYTPSNLKTEEEQRTAFPTSYMVVTRGDEVVLEGDRIIFKGKTYEVVSPPLDPSFLGHHLEIEVKLVTKEKDKEE